MKRATGGRAQDRQDPAGPTPVPTKLSRPTDVTKTTDVIGGPDGRQMEPNCLVGASTRRSQAGLVTTIWRQPWERRAAPTGSAYWFRLSLPLKMPTPHPSSANPSWRDTWLD